jgi:hypothetical protein
MLALAAVLIGRQTMHSEDARDAPVHVDAEEPFEAPTREAEPSAAAAAPSNATPSISAPATAAGTLRGRVIDAATRTPVKEFEIQIEPQDMQFNVNKKPPLTRTFRSASGRFEWQHLTAETWRLSVVARGYQRFDMSDLNVVSGRTAREVVLPLLRGHTVSGRVFDEASGAGIGTAMIKFREVHERRFSMRALSQQPLQVQADGSFVLEGVPPGRVTLSFSARNYVSRELDITVGETTAALDVALTTGGAISGYLVSADGAPATGSVILHSVEQRGSTGTRTTEAGEFSFEYLPAGRYELTGAASSGTGSQQISLVHNQRLAGIVLTLTRGRVVRGVVRGLAPDTLKESHVNLFHFARAGVTLSARVDEQGSYAIAGVPPGNVQVQLSAPGNGSINRRVVVPADEDLTLDFDVLAGFRLSGRMTQQGKPAVGKMVAVAAVGQHKDRHYEAISSQQGLYAIAEIPAGEYTLHAEGLPERRIEIRGDATLDIEIPSTQLGGRVLEEGSVIPVVSADVYVIGVQTPANIYLQEQTDHFGRFALTGLDTGDILLSIYKPGYEMYRERLSYDSPITNKSIRLSRSSGVEIRARVAQSDPSRRHLSVGEKIGDSMVIQLRIPLDENGVGSLPSALAGSTLEIYGGARAPIVIREWNGQPLDLNF